MAVVVEGEFLWITQAAAEDLDLKTSRSPEAMESGFGLT